MNQSALKLAGVFDGEPRPGLGFEADFTDRLAGAFADAVGSVLNLGQSAIQFLQQLSILFHQAERELLLVIVRAHVSHVKRKVGKIASAAAAKNVALER